MEKKSFSTILKDLINNIGIKGTFSETGNTFFFFKKSGSFNDVFNLFIHLNKLNSCYERFEKIGKETVTVQEMKYCKNDTVFHVILTMSKDGISGVIKKPKIIHEFEKRSNTMSKKYSVEDRVVVNMGASKKPSYFLADITAMKGEKYKVLFDDGDTEVIEYESIVGSGISKKCKKEINPEFLEDYLEEAEEEVVVVSKKKKPVEEEDTSKKTIKKPSLDLDEEDAPKKTSCSDEAILLNLKKVFKNLLTDVEEIRSACDIVMEKLSEGLKGLDEEKEVKKSSKPEIKVVEEDENWMDE